MAARTLSMSRPLKRASTRLKSSTSSDIQFSLFMPQIEQPVRKNHTPRLRGAFMPSVGWAEPRIHFDVAEESGNRVRA